MESLLKQLRELPARLQALPPGLRAALLVGAVVAVVGAVAVAGLTRGAEYQYVFTNLTQEDAAEATGVLRTAGIANRIEANGTALAVPADKIYDARILLSQNGLPRASGVGFEIFNNTDIGVSEFTQKVNLRRAIEGELARTIGKFQGVRSARVTVSLGEKGFYKEDDKKPSAAVVVTLQPGRTLEERELAGIRHLVSSSTPGLSPDQVSVMDGRGAVLSSESAWDSPEVQFQRKAERELEQKIVSLLEPVVGPGAVIARVSGSFDLSQMTQNSQTVDPEFTVLTDESVTSSNSSNQSTQPAAVTGAQANVPLAPVATGQGPTQQGNSQSNTNAKKWDFNKTNTQMVARIPRLQRISVAVIVDGVDGKPRAAAEVTRLGELARSAVNFDDVRGDKFEISSQPFTKSAELPEPPKVAAGTPAWVWGAIGAGVVVAALAAFVLTRKKAAPVEQELVLKPGQTVAALEAKQNAIDGVATEEKKPEQPVLVDPLAALKEKARAMVAADPDRAVMLVRAWLSQDLEKGTIDHV